MANAAIFDYAAAVCEVEERRGEERGVCTVQKPPKPNNGRGRTPPSGERVRVRRRRRNGGREGGRGVERSIEERGRGEVWWRRFHSIEQFVINRPTKSRAVSEPG